MITTGLEVSANAVNALSILLAARNSVHTWWTGIFGCALFGAVFFIARLYADTLLQVFFIGTSAVGQSLFSRRDSVGRNARTTCVVFIRQRCPSVPANDAADYDHREFVAMLCNRVLVREVDAVFTSEEYGDGFAAYLTESFRRMNWSSRPVDHVLVDRQRREVPISATELRCNLWRHWEFLPPPVARTLVQQIALLGGESSGKTVLAARLADELDTARGSGVRPRIMGGKRRCPHL
jgi:hypothetical protein